MSYRTVYLDWHNTACRSLFWGHWPKERRAPLQALLDDREDLFSDWMRGRSTAEEVVAELAAPLGLDAAFLFAELELSCRAMRLEPGILEAVAALRRRGVAVVLATDNMDTFRRFTAPALGLFEAFDAVEDSFSLGALKEDPDSPFFAAHPRPALLVDDREEASRLVRPGLDVAVVAGPGEAVEVLRGLID